MSPRIQQGIAGAAALAATFVLAACGGGDEAPSGEPHKPSEPVDLRMTVWTAEDAHLSLFQSIADDYVKENPDLVSSVKFEPVPFEDYTTKLTTQIAGGNPPDLGWIFESNAPEFVQSGALVDLTPSLESAEGYDIDDLIPSTLDLWKDGDSLYAYPFSNSPFGVFVNESQINAAGQTDPAKLVNSGKWTFDNARDIAAATAEDSGKQGLIVRDFDYKLWENLATVWDGWGAAPWSDDGSECTMADSEMVDAMQWIHDAAFQHNAMPGPGTTADFFAGDAAMTITQISRASELDDSFKWDLLPMPAGPAGQQNVIGQAGIGVFAQGEHPDVAADFLAFFTNPENTKKLAAYFPPPRASLMNAQTLADANPLLSREQLQSVVVDGIKDSVTKPSHKNFAKLQETVRSELDAMWTKDADVKGVLNDTCSAIQPLLEE
ncbi:sugar ABC transporter substrate-binding protein [Actinopolymorpha sp. B9G3]|uniref:ABC transporter substrate-binding protein n=1 Tax=Actinopolymorpha sp. B9G3 TaxID=3158970 RepID=UPI0032D99824